MLKAIGYPKSKNVPVHALGVQAHLNAQNFARNFDTVAFRTFLSEVASRGLYIFITEMDVISRSVMLTRRVDPRISTERPTARDRRGAYPSKVVTGPTIVAAPAIVITPRTT
jgi:GH35 family endo-1,4-beta-xylanase